LCSSSAISSSWGNGKNSAWASGGPAGGTRVAVRLRRWRALPQRCYPVHCWRCWRALPVAIKTFVKSLYCADHHPVRIGNERERLVTTSPVTTKSRAPAGGKKYPENGLVKPPRRDTRALSPAGMFEGKAPLRLAVQKSRLHAQSVPMRSAPAYFLCKWVVWHIHFLALGRCLWEDATHHNAVSQKHEISF
jgi:hypothetical protein